MAPLESALFPQPRHPEQALGQSSPPLLRRSIGIRNREHIVGTEQLADGAINSILDIVREHAKHLRLRRNHHAKFARSQAWTYPLNSPRIFNQLRSSRLGVEGNDPSNTSRLQRPPTLLPSSRRATHHDGFRLGNPHFLQAHESIPSGTQPFPTTAMRITSDREDAYRAARPSHARTVVSGNQATTRFMSISTSISNTQTPGTSPLSVQVNVRVH